jgi:tRNA1(Val) A37 N6-methylase TrmN6
MEPPTPSYETDANDRMMATGGRKTKSNKRKTTIKSLKSFKSKTRKSVATAIKDIPLSKARTDFAALKSMTCSDINQAAKVGNAVMDHYFFGHRLSAKTKRNISYYEWIKTNWKRNESEHSFYKFNRAQGKTPEKARYAVFRLYYGAIHGFKPLIAKWMYCTYQPRTAVLDFSAGWGGRCLGAMAFDVPYIGIDTNKDLRPVYERMVRELDPKAKDNIVMRFQDAATVDYSKLKYDMVLTSPPYFKTVKPVEGYAHMPHYNDRADFNARFLFPVIRNTFSNLAEKGTYALNIPTDMYDEINAAGILPPKLHDKHRLFLQPRFAKGNPKNPDVKYEEFIYVWKK